MKKGLVSVISVFIVLLLAGSSFATNGDNLISIGPIARSMGGVGIAAPQDAISAVFANPAAMCFGPYCPGSEVNFATTIFMPKAKTRIRVDALGIDTGWEDSEADMFIIPALGISVPITQQLRFGFAAYGVSGMGVDYGNKFDLDPMVANNQDVYTNLSILKIAPNLSYMFTPNFSVGASLHINNGALNLGDRTKSGLGFGAQIGAIYKKDQFSLGLVYATPQKISHNKVADFDGHPIFNPAGVGNDDLVLQSPQSLGFGVAFEPIERTLLIEANVKWLNWADAIGYEDFDWKDQWVFSLGVQYKPIPKLAIRAGVNYGNNPVDDNDGWAGGPGTTPIRVQGKYVDRMKYEILRITGFPALVETHLTVGIGYQITKSLSLDLGYTHAFEKSISESGTFFGMPAKVESSLSEDSVDFGITYRF